MGHSHCGLSLTNAAAKLRIHSEMTDFPCCVTVPLQCMKSAAPVSNAVLTVSRDNFGVIATYICPPGWYFAEGGTRRTLICTNGTWPQFAPMCKGIQ